MGFPWACCYFIRISAARATLTLTVVNFDVILRDARNSGPDPIKASAHWYRGWVGLRVNSLLIWWRFPGLNRLLKSLVKDGTSLSKESLQRGRFCKMTQKLVCRGGCNLLTLYVGWGVLVLIDGLLFFLCFWHVLISQTRAVHPGRVLDETVDEKILRVRMRSSLITRWSCWVWEWEEWGRGDIVECFKYTVQLYSCSSSSLSHIR